MSTALSVEKCPAINNQQRAPVNLNRVKVFSLVEPPSLNCYSTLLVVRRCVIIFIALNTHSIVCIRAGIEMMSCPIVYTLSSSSLLTTRLGAGAYFLISESVQRFLFLLMIS